MLDPKIIRDEPDRIKQMLKDRAVEFDFEKMLDFHSKHNSIATMGIKKYVIKQS